MIVVTKEAMMKVIQNGTVKYCSFLDSFFLATKKLKLTLLYIILIFNKKKNVSLINYFCLTKKNMLNYCSKCFLISKFLFLFNQQFNYLKNRLKYLIILFKINF